VSAHKAAKKELAALRKELEAAKQLKADVARLEEHVASLRSANSALKAQVQQDRPAFEQGSTSNPGISGPEQPSLAKLQQKVQLQAVELKSVVKALADKDAELAHAREELRARAASAARGAGGGGNPAQAEVRVCKVAVLRRARPRRCAAQAAARKPLCESWALQAQACCMCLILL
jgi:DNA repair exonuclease SbcCD ATPase subunit